MASDERSGSSSMRTKKSNLPRQPAEPGLRILFPEGEPESLKGQLIDIVAVHGIGANADHTWTTNGVNWLKDMHMLPQAVSSARIMRFAYDSQWLGKDAMRQSLSNVAVQLLSSLQTHREGCHDRPIIFIGHCFGGLVIQQALLSAKLHSDQYGSIFTQPAGVIFLGTPHRGTGLQKKAALIATIASSAGHGETETLLAALEPDSGMLTDLLQEFTLAVNRTGMPIVCFYEQRPSNVAGIVTTLFRSHEFIVDEISGSIPGHSKFGLGVDHFKINKFSSPEDGHYRYIRDGIVRMVDRALSQKREQLQVIGEADRECLQALFISDPSADMARIETTKDTPLDATGDWILQYSDFKKWLAVDGPSTLWIRGDPGKGKTMLAIALIKELSRRLEQRKTSNDVGVLSYFFCDNKDNRLRDAVSVLRGLTWQLLRRQPDLIRYFKAEYEKEGPALFTSPNALISLWRILHNILINSGLQMAYLVVDGLDESETESLETFLTLTQRPDHTSSACKIKWLFTGRNEDVLKQHLSNSLQISLERESTRVSATVQTFIEHKAEALAKKKNFTEDLKALVISTLRDKAEGTFLWVALACRELESPKVKSFHVKHRLLTLPSKLVPLYDRIYANIEELAQEPHEAEYALHVMDILRAVAIAFRPLSIEELVVAAGLPELIYEGQSMPELIDMCGSFLTERGGYIFLVHQSAKDYLMTSGRTKQLMPDLEMEHFKLTKRCLAWICNGGISESESAMRAPARHPGEHYAAKFWIGHSKSAASCVGQCLESAAEFFTPSSAIRATWLRRFWQIHVRQVSAERGYSHTMPENLSLLHLAAMCGLSWLVTSLSIHRDIIDFDARDSHGMTALHWSVFMESEEVLLLLCGNGATICLTVPKDSTFYQFRGATALYMSADAGNYNAILIFLKRGADVNEQGGKYGNALQVAALQGHEEIVRLLLDRGAKVNAQGGYHANALQAAAYTGKEEAVRLLLKRGADVNAQGGRFGNALQAAASTGHEEIVRLLLDRGAKVNAQGGYLGNTLQAAADNEKEEIVRMLLDRGADVNTQGGVFGTALIAATFRRNEEIVKLLLERGADVNTQGGSFGTALIAAALRRNEEVVKLLLERGAKDNTRVGVNGSSLEAARKMEKIRERRQRVHGGDFSHSGVIQLLIAAGAVDTGFIPSVWDRWGQRRRR